MMRARTRMADEDSLESTRMSLGEHLEELRSRLFERVVVVVIAFAAAWWFNEPIAKRVLWPWTMAAEKLNADLEQQANDKLAADPTLPRTTYFTTNDAQNHELKNGIDPRPAMLG